LNELRKSHPRTRCGRPREYKVMFKKSIKLKKYQNQRLHHNHF